MERLYHHMLHRFVCLFGLIGLYKIRHAFVRTLAEWYFGDTGIHRFSPLE